MSRAKAPSVGRVALALSACDGVPDELLCDGALLKVSCYAARLREENQQLARTVELYRDLNKRLSAGVEGIERA